MRLGKHQDFDDEIGLVLQLQQVGSQAGRQTGKQAGRQAGRQAEILIPLSEGTHGRCYRLKQICKGSPSRDP